MQHNWDARKEDTVFFFPPIKHSGTVQCTGWRKHRICQTANSFRAISPRTCCFLDSRVALQFFLPSPPYPPPPSRIGSKGFLSRMHVQIYCNFFCTSSIAVGAALSAMSLFSGQQASVLCLLFVSIVYKGIVLPMCVYALSSASSKSIEWAACCAQGSTFQSLRFYGKWYLECFVYIGNCRSDEIKGSWLTALFLPPPPFFWSLLNNFHRTYRLFSVID